MKIISAALALALASTALAATPALARHGADDTTVETRHGHGKDDGAGHTMLKNGSPVIFARRGADDPAGDDRGGKGQRRGHGADDGTNHT